MRTQVKHSLVSKQKKIPIPQRRTGVLCLRKRKPLQYYTKEEKKTSHL